MTWEDIGDIFQAMEDDLFAMAIRNMKRHEDWEKMEGFKWTQWQAEQITGLREYRKNVAGLTNSYFDRAKAAIIEFLKEAYKGSVDDARGFAALFGKKRIRPGFFGVNSSKLDIIINEAVQNIDTKRYAAINRMNSGYTDFLRKADIYAQSGSYTIPQAVDIASRDFLAAGLNCVEYRNGNRVNIASYAEMALRTSSSEVTRQANGDVRNELGEYLVVSNVIGMTCPYCQEWQGKVMIDDVYSDGKPDGKHKLVSEAKADHFLHPNCRHQLFMYIEGITKVADLPNDVETKEHYKAEQEQRRQEREIRKYKRLRDGAVDPADRQKYDARVKEWMAKHNQYLQEHDYLRKNPKRLAPGYTGDGKPVGSRMALRDNKLGLGEDIYTNGEKGYVNWPSSDKYPIHEKNEVEKMYEYARDRGFKLERIEGYRGDYQSVKENIERAQSVFDHFPELKDEPIVLRLGNEMNSQDFAMTTSQGTIFLNADAFRDRETLEIVYSEAISDGIFVKGTDSTAILCHELGHRYAEMHPEINCISLAEKIIHNIEPSYDGDVMEYLIYNLSGYSAQYADGREIISECFAGAFGGSGNEFALKFIEELDKIY